MNENDMSALQDKQITNNESFRTRALRLNIAACNVIQSDDFDVAQATRENKEGLSALKANGGLQEMLAAQMLSIHSLQQLSMALAHSTLDINTRQYFTNTAIKLANTFVQQANLLARLQDNTAQKMTVERIEVHHGGQAIVGNVNSSSTPKEK